MYDPDKEEFVPVTTDMFDHETMTTAKGLKVFSVGEIFMLRGLPMRVRKITKKDLLLRPDPELIKKAPTKPIPTERR